MHKIRVFLNNKASQGSRPKWTHEVHRQLFRSQIDFISPPSLDELKSSLKKAVSDAVDLVISVGGDGTVNTLIQELGGSETAFLVLPAGTANDFAKELGVENHIKEALQSIRAGKPEKIDLIRINSTLMATNGGVGLAANVAMSVNVLRDRIPYFKPLMKLIKHRVYSMTLAQRLISPGLEYYNFKMESAKHTEELKSPLILINNQPSVGGSFKIAPSTRNNDGSFNVSVLKHTKRLDLIRCIAKIKNGESLLGDPNFLSFETKHLKMQFEKPVYFYGDGEIFEKTDRYEISIAPQALKVYGYRKLTQGES